MFIFLIVLGFIIFYPLVNFIPIIVQGDIGRDLYAYQRTMEGAMPYRDYYWNFGPLMPYYYAAMMKILGTNISSILIGRILLNLCSGALIFLILKRCINKWVALVGVLWFWAFNPDFSYTFNHTAGITVSLFILFLVLQRLKYPWQSTDGLMAIAFGVMLLIKLNMGIVVMAATILIFAILRITFSFRKIIILPLGVAGCIYGAFIVGLPLYYLRQCFPFMPGYEPYRSGIFDSFGVLVREFVLNLSGQQSTLCLNSLYPDYIHHLVFVLMVGVLLVVFIAGNFLKLNKAYRDNWAIVSIIGIFIFFMAHEFILSAQSYRLWWITPFIILLGFLICGFALQYVRLVWTIVFIGVIACIILSEVQGKYALKQAVTQDSQQHINLPNLKVYSKNPVVWTKIVSQTTRFLQDNLKEHESFLVLPYEPIYYYLQRKSAPVPEIIFFDYLHITKEQQERIIHDLKANNVKWVVISSRQCSREQGLGCFGKSYGETLAAYIYANYLETETIGNWQQQGGWITPIANKIYRRINP